MLVHAHKAQLLCAPGRRAPALGTRACGAGGLGMAERVAACTLAEQARAHGARLPRIRRSTRVTAVFARALSRSQPGSEALGSRPRAAQQQQQEAVPG